MKKIIFSTEITDEDLKCAEEWLQEQGYPSSEMAICEEAAEQKRNWQDDEISNLDMFLEGNILLIADLGLWNGRKSGYRIIDNNVGNILSSLSIRWLKKLAPIHPSRGIKAWKKPKLMAITSIGRSRARFNIIPLAIETAKQSIASPTASSQISNPVISRLKR